MILASVLLPQVLSFCATVSMIFSQIYACGHMDNWKSFGDASCPHFCFFFFYPYPLSVAKCGTNFILKQCAVRFLHVCSKFQKQRAKEAIVSTNVCVQRYFPLEDGVDSSACVKALHQVSTYACPVPAKDQSDGSNWMLSSTYRLSVLI